MNVIVNTSTLANGQSELKKEQNYYQNKKSTFTSASFGATGQLSSFLTKINTTYNMISKNIENISNYLDEYIKDVEGLENIMSNGSGNIKASTVSSVVNKYKNSIDKYNLDSETLFDVQTYKSANSTTNIGKTNNNKNSINSTLVNTGASALSLLKGVGNIGGLLMGTAGVIASNVSTLFGNKEKTNETMENVNYNKVSGELGILASRIAAGVVTARMNNVAGTAISMTNLGTVEATTASKAATVAKMQTAATAMKEILNITSPYRKNQMEQILSDQLGIAFTTKDGKISPNIEYGPTKDNAERKVEVEVAANKIFNKIQEDAKTAPRTNFVNEWAPRLDKYLAGSPLAGYGKTFADAAYEAGIDPRFSAAIACTESSKGAHCFKSHNAWGWGRSSWESWEDAIYAHAKGLAKGYGYTVSEAGAKKYCPPTWRDWYNTVSSEINKI